MHAKPEYMQWFWEGGEWDEHAHGHVSVDVWGPWDLGSRRGFRDACRFVLALGLWAESKGIIGSGADDEKDEENKDEDEGFKANEQAKDGEDSQRKRNNAAGSNSVRRSQRLRTSV
jgi:hypothetical protein